MALGLTKCDPGPTWGHSAGPPPLLALVNLRPDELKTREGETTEALLLFGHLPVLGDTLG